MEPTDQEDAENRRRIRNNRPEVLKKGLVTADMLMERFDDEITRVTKASELRLREFAKFAIGCATGEITVKEANRLYRRYQGMWGEALPGYDFPAKNAPDRNIMRSVNARGDDWEAHLKYKGEDIDTHWRRLVGEPPPGGPER